MERLMALLIGAVADDFTGGTDLAGMLVRHGLRTILTVGVPAVPLPADVDAVVVALKSRTIAPAEAVALSLEALAFLRAQACRQIYFKYCSTFDSTPEGNIGPVAEALMAALGTDLTIFCPAFPANGRTVYQGHLFVGAQLLSDSSMRHHPLTPMTDANLVRVLQAQARRQVGLVDAATVAAGPHAIATRLAELQQQGQGLAVVDTVSDLDLEQLGAACAGLPLVTGGSGLALGLARALREQGRLPAVQQSDALAPPRGAAAVIAGSCSAATQGQVAMMRAQAPSFAVTPEDLAGGRDVVAAALDWARPRLGHAPVLIASTAPPGEVRAAQQRHGAEALGAAIEQALAAIAVGLVDAGVGRLIVAGGETSGAVVGALGVAGLRIGPQIDPGVPWTQAIGRDADASLSLALKSGNFGTPDFFLKAWAVLERAAGTPTS
jgi:uncharacterized protein YgbK (DUF1537 family)